MGIFTHLESSGHPKVGREKAHLFSVSHKSLSSSKTEIIPAAFSWEICGVQDFSCSFPWSIGPAVNPWVGLCSSVPGFGSPPLWAAGMLMTKLHIKSAGKTSLTGLSFPICGLFSEHSCPPLLMHSLLVLPTPSSESIQDLCHKSIPLLRTCCPFLY